MTSTILEFGESSVADVAVQYPHALTIFYKYNIDFCCGGKKSFKAACEKKGLNPGMIWDEIVHGNSVENSNTLRFNNWDSTLLVDYIIQNHQAYVKEAVPQLQELLDKISRKTELIGKGYVDRDIE